MSSVEWHSVQYNTLASQARPSFHARFFFFFFFQETNPRVIPTSLAWPKNTTFLAPQTWQLWEQHCTQRTVTTKDTHKSVRSKHHLTILQRHHWCMCEYTANTSKESFKPSLAIARRVSATCLIPGAINEEKEKKKNLDRTQACKYMQERH